MWTDRLACIAVADEAASMAAASPPSAVPAWPQRAGPDHKVAEIVDGDLHVSPRPASRHALAAAGLERANLWLVNPLARTLEVYRLAENRWILLGTHEGTELVRAEPFAAVEIDLGRLWAEP